jgi:hypothetical protein
VGDAEDISMRLARLEVWREQAEVRFSQLNRSLDDNTAMTAAVKADTAELVALFKASKVNLSVVKWASGVGLAILSAWQLIRHWG